MQIYFFNSIYRNSLFRRILCVVVSAIVIMCLINPMYVYATDNSEWKTVHVSTGINKALYIDENGEAQGYCSKYLEKLAKINHWNIEYVEASWTDSVQNLYDGKIDLLFPTQMTEERKTTMGFSTSIGGYQPIGLYANADSNYNFDDYENFNGAKIALSAGTSNETVMQQYAALHNFSYTPVYLNSTQDKMDALADGTVDLLVFSTLNDVEDGKVVAMLDYLPFYYCTDINNAELLDELNYGMNQMILREPAVVQEVFANFMNRNISFAYTAQEEKAIKAKNGIVVGVYKDAPPLFTVNKDGSFSGIYVDLIKHIENISGLDIIIEPLDSNEYAFDYIEQGKLDFVLGSSDQTMKFLDDNKYVESNGIMDYYTVAISRPDFTPGTDSEMKFALTNSRRNWTDEIKSECTKATFEFYDTSKECLEAVQSGKADMTLLNTWEYNYQSKNDRFQYLIEWEASRTLSETVFVSIQDKDELIRSVLNKAIEQIPNAEKEAIITANLNGSYEDFNFADKLYSLKESLLIFGFLLLIVIVGFVVYIIMRKKYFNELKDKNTMLKQANDSKDRFLSRMSHELRTPLHAIDGYTSIAKQSLTDSEIDIEALKLNLDCINRAVKYQLAIISDLLDIQKIESGKLELHNIEVDISKYLEEIVSMIKPEAEEKNIEFTYERISVVKDSYFIDGVRFQQVLLNLLHNAIKFTPSGGHVKMTVEVIDQTTVNNTLKFVITDDGVGISEDFKKNYLFKRFAQEYSGTTSPYEGCGTGLAISREIMHMMGGEISCESIQGKGSTFTVILVAQHMDKKRRARTKMDFSQYDLSGRKILLVEDNPMNQEMECKLLEKMNCVVDIADDGVIGFEKFSNSDIGFYDIILMDVRMPNMDGWECTRLIRALEREDAKAVPILAVSANAFDEDVKQSLDAGMNEHLAKPIGVKIFYEKIKQYCPEKCDD